MKTIQVCFVRTAFAALLALAPLTMAFADEAPEVTQVETEEAKSPTAPETWASGVQAKYSLTDAQMKSLSDAGLKGPHLAFAAELAKASGKSIDEVIAMRTTEKMGWGAIAKKLGVPPGSLGQSVASLRHDLKENRGQAKKEEKMAEKSERKQAHDEMKADRKAEREARKAERKEARADRKSEHKSH
jgi:hypothetical protein